MSGRLPAAGALDLADGVDHRFEDLKYLEPVRDYKARHASTILTFDAIVDAIGQIERARGGKAA